MYQIYGHYRKANTLSVGRKLEKNEKSKSQLLKKGEIERTVGEWETI